MKNASRTQWLIDSKGAGRREAVASTLRKHGAFLFWHPRDVDRALNAGEADATINDLCDLIADATDGFPCPSADALSAAVRGDRTLIESFLLSTVRRRVVRFAPTGEIPSPSWSLEAGWDFLADAAASYRPVGSADASQFFSWGWNAYLCRLAPVLGRRYLLQHRASNGIETRTDSVAPELWWHDKSPQQLDRVRILDALRSALCTPERYELFYSVAYEGGSARQFARKIGNSKSGVSRNISARIVCEMKTFLADPSSAAKKAAAGNFGNIARSTAALFFAEEFRRAVPPPIGSSGSAQTKCIVNPTH